MKNFLSYVIFLLLVVTTSCITQKNLVLLKDEKADIGLKTENETSKNFDLKENDYTLKPKDVISIEVFSLTQQKYNFFDRPKIELTISNQGAIELPILGQIQVAGLSITQTEEKLKAVAVDYLQNPTVNVKLLNFNFTVLGEVQKEGTFNTSNYNINILEAIGVAEGLTDFANRSKIRIIRHEKEKAHIFYVDLLEDNLLMSKNYYIQPNDIIVVDPLRVKSYRNYYASNISLAVSVLTAIAVIVFRLN